MSKPFAAECDGEQGRVLNVLKEKDGIVCIFLGRTNTVKKKVPIARVECLHPKAAARLKKAIQELL